MVYLSNKKKITISYTWLQSLVVTVILFLFLSIIYYNEINIKWIKTLSRLAVLMMGYQIYILLKTKRNFFSFEIWFVIFSYLFMFGQLIIVGLFGIEKITALGYNRNVLDYRYSSDEMFRAAIFILCCIQSMVTFFVIKSNKKCEIITKQYPEILSAAIVMILIGLPCHLIYSVRMISIAQNFNSYDAITEKSGLVDDFANFFIYGLICLIFSKYISRKKLNILLLIVICYFIIIMGLTGDRRYQVVSIMVLLLAFLKSKKTKFSWKYIFLCVTGYFMLLLFYVLREIRTDSLVSGVKLFQIILEKLGSNTNILLQTLYEFGGSFYTVCLGFKYMPQVIPFKYGLTIISGIISIIPLGFLYQNMKIFTVGRLGAELMKVGSTTVGTSIFADLYGNFGFIGGIIFSAFIGFILMKIFYSKKDKFSKGYFEARYYILFYALIHIVRASFTEVIRTSVWGLIILYISSLAFNKIIIKHHVKNKKY